MQLSDAELAKLRQSGIRLDEDGRFWHDGAEVTHPGMRAAFYRWLDQDSDGRYLLRLDARRFVYLDVDGAPFVIRSLRWQGDRAFIRLADDSEEELDARSVRVRPGGAAYATVKGRFEGRFSTAAWGALQERLVERSGQIVLDAAGGPYPIG